MISSKVLQFSNELSCQNIEYVLITGVSSFLPCTPFFGYQIFYVQCKVKFILEIVPFIWCAVIPNGLLYNDSKVVKTLQSKILRKINLLEVDDGGQ